MENGSRAYAYPEIKQGRAANRLVNMARSGCLYSRDLVCWSLGEIIYRIHGGYNRIYGYRTIIELPSIIACGGKNWFAPGIILRLATRPCLSVMATSVCIVAKAFTAVC